MTEVLKLTKDQERRIEATLRRIRRGLQRSELKLFEEPAHVFSSEPPHGKKD